MYCIVPLRRVVTQKCERQRQYSVGEQKNELLKKKAGCSFLNLKQNFFNRIFPAWKSDESEFPL